MNSEQKAILAGLIAALVCFLAGGWFGLEMGRKRAENKPPKIEVRVDTVTITQVRVDTVEKVRTITAYLPVVPDDDEPMDTIDNPYDNPPDSAAVEIPISRYVAEQDSLYRVVAEGYAVDFKEITVYPKTVTICHQLEVPKPTHWGIGVQAGYGATLSNNTVKLAPYIGVGISYNIITW
jgi:hypothetical protein